jgi:hypothetical protein
MRSTKLSSCLRRSKMPWDVLAGTSHLTVVVEIEQQVRRLNRKLEFDEAD